MPKPSVWATVTERVRGDIYQLAKDVNPTHAAKQYESKIGLSWQSILIHIKKHQRNETVVAYSPRRGKMDVKDTSKTRDLDVYEKQFIEDLRTGAKDSEDIARYILANYMENVFRNPELIKSIDAFRAEMLKLKKQEQKDRQSQAMVLVSMMFNGQVPPPHCPKCGMQLYSIEQKLPTLAEDAEVVEE